MAKMTLVKMDNALSLAHFISVAKPYGRFGQKLESLQGRSGPGTGQGNTVQDRSWQKDRSKAAEQK